MKSYYDSHDCSVAKSSGDKASLYENMITIEHKYQIHTAMHIEMKALEKQHVKDRGDVIGQLGYRPQMCLSDQSRLTWQDFVVQGALDCQMVTQRLKTWRHKTSMLIQNFCTCKSMRIFTRIISMARKSNKSKEGYCCCKSAVRDKDEVKVPAAETIHESICDEQDQTKRSSASLHF